jgi:predicted RNase H-like nuclease (RuvC/YqgF family)
MCDLHVEQPKILAVESIHESTQRTTNMHTFFSKLPINTKSAQITEDSVKMETLSHVAIGYDFSFGKQNPVEKAKISALLASLGANYEILTYAGITDTIVFQKRVPRERKIESK